MWWEEYVLHLLHRVVIVSLLRHRGSHRWNPSLISSNGKTWIRKLSKECRRCQNNDKKNNIKSFKALWNTTRSLFTALFWEVLNMHKTHPKKSPLPEGACTIKPFAKALKRLAFRLRLLGMLVKKGVEMNELSQKWTVALLLFLPPLCLALPFLPTIGVLFSGACVVSLVCLFGPISATQDFKFDCAGFQDGLVPFWASSIRQANDTFKER